MSFRSYGQAIHDVGSTLETRCRLLTALYSSPTFRPVLTLSRYLTRPNSESDFVRFDVVSDNAPISVSIAPGAYAFNSDPMLDSC